MVFQAIVVHIYITIPKSYTSAVSSTGPKILDEMNRTWKEWEMRVRPPEGADINKANTYSSTEGFICKDFNDRQKRSISRLYLGSTYHPQVRLSPLVSVDIVHRRNT